MVWPLFGSTESFIYALIDSYEEIKDSIFEWPRDEPDLTPLQIEKELLASGDTVGAKFAWMLKFINGNNFICVETSRVISELYLF